jgi:hypothetical protein
VYFLRLIDDGGEGHTKPLQDYWYLSERAEVLRKSTLADDRNVLDQVRHLRVRHRLSWWRFCSV